MDASTVMSTVADERNINLSSSQMELLVWHWKFGHMSTGMQHIQCLLHSERNLDSDINGTLEPPAVVCTAFKTTRTWNPPLPKCCSNPRTFRLEPLVLLLKLVMSVLTVKSRLIAKTPEIAQTLWQPSRKLESRKVQI